MMQSPHDHPNGFSPAMQAQEEVHLSDYLAVLYRRRKIALWGFFAVVIGVALYTFLAPPVFEASATLHVTDEKSRGNLMSELGLTQESPIETEIEILKARTNVEEVVNRLKLTWRTEEDKDVEVRVVDFQSAAEEPVYRIELTGDNGYQVESPEGDELGRGRSGELFRKAGLSLMLTDLHGPQKGAFQLTLAPFNQTVKGLREGINASEVGKGTNIIRISYRNTDPELAKNVVNTLARVYLERSVRLKTEEASRSVEFITTQLDDVRSLLDTAEENLEDFKRDYGVVKLDSEAETLIDRLSEMETRRAQLALLSHQADFAVESLEKALQSGEVYAPAVLTDQPVVAALGNKLAELQIKKRALESELTPQHPEVATLRQQIAETQEKLLATYRATRAGLREQNLSLAKDLDGYEVRLKKLPVAERRLARLTRLANVNAEIYTFLLQKHEEARIAKAATISNINIIDPAIVPDKPVKPQKKKNILLGIVVGLMFGTGLVFFREYMDDTIKDPDVAKSIFGKPVFAVIPYLGSKKVSQEQGRGADDRILISDLEPKSPGAEAFRSLRTSLHYSCAREKKKVILVTSSFPGEGKTTVSANLAAIMAQTGAKVLLAGVDLRKPTLHTLFNQSPSPGLSEFLIGDAAMEEAVRKSDVPNLDFLPAGTPPPNPSELLGSAPMTSLLRDLRERYDYIILDAAPLLAVTDAAVVTSQSDMVLVVLQANAIPLKAARSLKDTLDGIAAPVSGVVFNDKTGEGVGYYGGHYGNRYGYGYGHGYYGEDDPINRNRSLLKRIFGGGRRA